ncbi:uncharacterized protein JCM10292_001695 [Rhodotorula paludigena]|uniref:uncharacterized protein n=1 Tax=Rhodotorula paludigena TaxID=86838 RepID=UPI00316D3758
MLTSASSSVKFGFFELIIPKCSHYPSYIVHRFVHGDFPVLDGLLDCHEPNNAALLACHLRTSGPPLLALWRTTHRPFEQQMDCSGTERWDVLCDNRAQIAYASEILRILADASLFGGGDAKDLMSSELVREYTERK